MYRNRRKTGVKVLTVIAILAILLGIGAFVFEKHTIKTVYVEGNAHYTKEEIQNMVMDGPLGNNSLYLSLKFRDKGMENVPFVDVMNVSIISPDTIKITVYEKSLVGYVKYLDTNMYFDKDGYVVESSAVRIQGIPQVTGLAFDYMVLDEPLPVEDAEVFTSILDITKLLKKYELESEKIFFHASGDITVYFGDVKVALGNEPARMEDKITLLPTFLPELEGKTGTLQMEKYDEGSGKYTFKPD